MMPISSEEAHNEASEQTLIRKASEVEQLVLRLQFDEYNELNRA